MTGPLLKYRCHKEVYAAKIEEITCGRDDGKGPGQTLNVAGGTICVGEAYIHKHDPEAGGYYVRYEDGYESFSPAKAFEGGYTLIS